MPTSEREFNTRLETIRKIRPLKNGNFIDGKYLARKQFAQDLVGPNENQNGIHPDFGQMSFLRHYDTNNFFFQKRVKNVVNKLFKSYRLKDFSYKFTKSKNQ